MAAEPAHDRLDFGDVEALSFSCYGTLIDRERGILEALAGWAARAGATGEDALLGYFGEVEADNEAATPGAVYPEVLRRCLIDIGQEYGTAPTEQELAGFGGSVGAWPAFPDSVAALAALAAEVPLVVVSNVDAASFEASDAALGRPFAHRILAGDVGAYKPADRHFDALTAHLEASGIRRDSVLHVAHSDFHDHVPAARHRLRSVRIDRRHGRSGPGATPASAMRVTPMATFTSMAEFTAAFLADR